MKFLTGYNRSPQSAEPRTRKKQRKKQKQKKTGLITDQNIDLMISEINFTSLIKTLKITYIYNFSRKDITLCTSRTILLVFLTKAHVTNNSRNNHAVHYDHTYNHLE